jgi:hypothetical protein
MTIELTLPDGSTREYEDGTTGFDVASSIGAGLARAAVAVTVDGDMLDLERPIDRSGTFSVVTENTEAGRYVLRHSSAHVMAQAVLDLYPGTKFAIGPAITDGFYYDFDIDRPFTPEDLERIEALLLSAAHLLVHSVVSKRCPSASARHVLAGKGARARSIAGQRPLSTVLPTPCAVACRAPATASPATRDYTANQRGSPASGRSARTWSRRSRRWIPTRSISAPIGNSNRMADPDPLDLDPMLSMPDMVLRISSMGRVINRSTSSGDEEGYEVET